MTERWKRSLDALGRAEPEPSDLRERALRGRRFPDPPRRKGSAILAGTLSVGLALASFAVLRNAFDGGSGRPSPVPSDVATGSLDPAAICDVPAYDPNVVLLGDDFSSVFGSAGARQVPLGTLEAPGEPASSIVGPAADALRSYLLNPQAVHAPSDGWRAIVESPSEVIFAAPPDEGSSDWWVTRFAMAGGEWTPRETELVDQHRTPAQLGRGLGLTWGETTVVDDGVWGSTLQLTNDREASWSSGENGYALWGVAHVFDPDTLGEEVGHAAKSVGAWEARSTLTPGETARLPLSLGGALSALDPGHEYDVVACVPQLGLASPVGTLRVAEHPMSDATVLTYPFTGVAMLALGTGRLVVHNGCLAVESSPTDRRPTYVLWPDGTTLVHRDGELPVLIDAVGTEIARLGEEVTLGGGYVGLEHVEGQAIGGIPGGCRVGGEGYFLTSGLAGG